MALKDPFSDFPLRMRIETQALSRVYVRESDCFAVHGPVPPALTALVLYSFDDPVINVCRGEVPALSGFPSELILTPVYRLEPNGPQGVPSGNVFIRLRSQVPVEDRQPDIEACGFCIRESLSYAPHAAWIRSQDGNIATALNGIAKLHDVHDMELVEPQMLMIRVPRSSDGSPSNTSPDGVSSE
ncbi:MAG: hypothetical protein NPIRA03_30010 [Nitrospirales bacterium]|nr:MAG: hypothetical protein NPIRA03_30010 [Nitrospirales bacterium]